MEPCYRQQAQSILGYGCLVVGKLHKVLPSVSLLRLRTDGTSEAIHDEVVGVVVHAVGRLNARLWVSVTTNGATVLLGAGLHRCHRTSRIPAAATTEVCHRPLHWPTSCIRAFGDSHVSIVVFLTKAIIIPFPNHN